MIYNKLIILFLFIYFINYQCSGFIIQDITPNNQNRQYTGDKCSLIKLILCIAEGSERCDSLSVVPSTSAATRITYNDTAAIYQLDINNLSPDNYTFTINSVYNLNIECIGYNLDTINLKLVNKYYLNPLPSYNSYTLSGLIRVEGIDTSQPFSIGTIGYYSFPQLMNGCSMENLATVLNYYLLNCYYSLDQTFDISSPLELKVEIGSVSKSFYLDPIGKDFEDSSLISNYKTSPQIINSVLLAGFNQGPLIQFTTNQNYINSLYLFKPSFYYVLYPISGNDSSTTFILNVDTFGPTFTYQLYHLNNNLFELAQTINNQIAQYIYDSPQLDVTPSLISYQDSKPILNFRFTSTVKYSLTSFTISTSGEERAKSFPYGFKSGRNDQYIYSTSFVVLPFENQLSSHQISVRAFDFSGPSLSYSNQMSGNASYPPIVYNIETYHLVSDLYLYRIYAEIPNSLLLFKSVGTKRYGYETLIDGNYNSGVFELIFQKDLSISLYDTFGLDSFIFNKVPLSVNPVNIFNSPSSFINFDITSIQDVSFLYNELNVTNQRQFNVLYFNFTDDVPRDTPFILVPLSDALQNVLAPKDVLKENMFYSTYNQQLKLFEIEFYVERNTPSGYYQFNIVYGNKVVHCNSILAQLNIKSSNMDLRGPIIKQMNISIPTFIDSNNIKDELKWSFIIEDLGNGFDYGYMVVRGEIDSSIYNFTFNSNDVLDGGDIYLGTYEFKITVNYPCVTQNYIITESALYDQVGRISYFSLYADFNRFSAIMNPFTELLNLDSVFNKLPVTCAAFSDSTPPVLDLFRVSESSIDVSKTNRQITFTFAATDLESGIKGDQYPIVYINGVKDDLLECKSSIISITPNTALSSFGNTISYSCTIQLPLSFGYSTSTPYIYFSVYGFINNNGYYSGFSTNDLMDLGQGFTYSILTSFTTFEPTIESHFRITERGGDLWLFGRALSNLDSTTKAYITFNDSSMASIDPTTTYPSAILLKNVKATDKPYQIYIQVNGLKSNIITIIPILFNNFIEPSSSSDMLPTLSPLPTNSPQSCPGNPICGGPSNGKCIENQGCVCYSPWIGLDCLSQIIIIDQPTTNDTSPSTNITLPVNNNNSSTTVTYKSLITLVSIRELNILGSVVYNKSFDKWQVRELDSTTFIYNTTLSINKNNQISTTEFTVTLKWFTNETTIKFANEQLLMNPSTMKYTIEINNYPFDNNLNQLQLIMSASLQSNSSDNICSLREYGETTSGDNSNYLKIQVDNHSLFGRFIRRGIIDSTTTTITNVLLDKDMNSITTTKELQSYIAIQIPNYKISVIVDPDFSIIIDSYSASSKSNSICSSKSKLTNGKIAGIVIGCAAFLAVIIIAVSYHIIKKKKDAKFVQSVNQKMKQMNNDKL